MSYIIQRISGRKVDAAPSRWTFPFNPSIRREVAIGANRRRPRVCQACEYLHDAVGDACPGRRCPTRVGTSHAYVRAFIYGAPGTDGYRSLSASSAATDTYRRTLRRRYYRPPLRATRAGTDTRRSRAAASLAEEKDSPASFLLGQVERFRCFNSGKVYHSSAPSWSSRTAWNARISSSGITAGSSGNFREKSS